MTDEEPRRRRKLSAIMMADVCGFSRMMGENEERTVDLIRDFHRRVRTHVESFEGRVVDTAGDSVFGEFDSVVNAVSCAQAIQEEQTRINAGRSEAEHISTRIGVHLGDVIVEDYNVYGDGVNIAARLEPIADPGGICISEAVYQQVRDRLEVPVQDLGLRDLKNIQYPVRVFKIAPLEAPPVRAAEAAARQPAASQAPPSEPAPLAPESPVAPGLSTDLIVLLLVGVVLLLSPGLLFPSGGVLPTGGAILVALAVGRLLARRRGSHAFLMALGLGIASGALFTNWSRITNILFVVGGAIVAAAGRDRRRRRSRRLPP